MGNEITDKEISRFGFLKAAAVLWAASTIEPTTDKVHAATSA